MSASAVTCSPKLTGSNQPETAKRSKSHFSHVTGRSGRRYGVTGNDVRRIKSKVDQRFCKLGGRRKGGIAKEDCLDESVYRNLQC
uniref:Uncharacterized protein n=1 Tax=Curvibacter symbiont subsp. Hydra magnipapillata TaxID=667019 RepID=C9Y951_CURXX|nr:hypothetical protein Csp_A06520 [Curvibacter putative symbiont of Hydra magnipapillata]